MQGLEVFEILVVEHADSLRVFLSAALRNQAGVDEVFQETLITAWRNLEKFDRSRSFGPWLRGIAARLVLAHRRKAAKLPMTGAEIVLEQLQARMAGEEKPPRDALDEQLSALRACMQGLSSEQRTAIKHRYEQALTPTQIARLLQAELETVKKRLHRAREQLLNCVKQKLALLEGAT